MQISNVWGSDFCSEVKLLKGIAVCLKTCKNKSSTKENKLYGSKPRNEGRIIHAKRVSE